MAAENYRVPTPGVARSYDVTLYVGSTELDMRMTAESEIEAETLAYGWACKNFSAFRAAGGNVKCKGPTK